MGTLLRTWFCLLQEVFPLVRSSLTLLPCCANTFLGRNLPSCDGPGILGGSSGLHGLPTLSLGGVRPLLPGLGGVVNCLEVRIYRNWVVEGPLSCQAGVADGA